MKSAKKRANRHSRGFVLAAIIVFTLCVFSIIIAIFPLILNITRSESITRSMSELRSAAEIGVDYAVQQLNDTAANSSGKVATIDPGPSLVPTQYLGTFGSSAAGGTVTITLKQPSGSDWTSYSSIYTQLSPNSLTPPPNDWRIVDSTARRGLLSRTIRVFLEPRYDVLPNDSIAQGGSASPTSFFKNPLLAKQLTIQPSGSGNLSVDALPQSSGAPVPTLAAAGAEGVNLAGSVTVTGAPTAPDPANVTGPDLATKPFFPTDKTSLTPAPSPGSGSASNLLSSSNFEPIPQGSYTTTFLNFTGTNTAKITSPVRFYIRDGVDQVVEPDAVQIDSKAIQNNTQSLSDGTGGDTNLQIWYDGQRPISIKLSDNGEFSGLIYAPNSVVTVSGAGTFKGALVGKIVNISNTGKVLIDTRLSSASSAPNIVNGLNYSANADVNLVVHGYKAVSWKEYP